MRAIDPYAKLGIPETATPLQIRRVAARLIFENHPDRNGGTPEANEHLRDILAAYEMLRTPEARAKTDAQRRRVEAERLARVFEERAKEARDRATKSIQEAQARDARAREAQAQQQAREAQAREPASKEAPADSNWMNLALSVTATKPVSAQIAWGVAGGIVDCALDLFAKRLAEGTNPPRRR